MKIPLGFTLGFVSGAYAWSKLTEEQRAGIADKLDRFASTGRTAKIARTIRSGVGDVADVATGRITDATETVTDAAASAISSDDATSPHTAAATN
ncbi:MAG: hypothetical protein ACLGHQ_12005 [Acidimicrobiia bacterium]